MSTHADHHNAVIARTVALYRSGLSLAQVGERMDCTAANVRHRLVKADEPRRPAGRSKGTTT